MVRIQFCGPWTESGANPKWAYRQTHWVAAFRTVLEEGQKIGVAKGVFDVNAGVQWLDDWKRLTVPKLAASYKRANGEWFVTHSWEVDRA